MKVTIESLMAGEHLPYTIHNTRVSLDGQIVPKAFAADDQEGWVEHYVLSWDGKFIIDETGEQFKTRRSYGEVRFHMNGEAE